jgi:hypothetical protein
MPIRRRIIAEDSVLLRKEQLKNAAKTRSMRSVKSVTLKKPIKPVKPVKKSPVPDNFSPYKHSNLYDDYDNCEKICSYLPPEERNECIQDIISDGLGTCSKAPPCVILKTIQFKALLRCFLKVLKIIYCIRSLHGNTYDDHMIRVISKIKPSRFGISMNDLKCVKFPGNGDIQKGFPTTLYDYMKIMVHIDYAMRKGIPLHSYPPLHDNFEEFASDIQPWTRMLSTFVNVHVGGVPDITNIKSYGSFISDRHRYVKLVDDLDKIQSKMLTFIGY